MLAQKISKKYIPEDDEESDLIINNDDFWSNEKKINSEINNNWKNKNNNPISLYNLSESLLSSSQNNNIGLDIQNKKYSKSEKIINQKKTMVKLNNNEINNNQLNNKNSDKDNNNHISSYNDEKTIFSKIAEDLYIDNMQNIKSKKSIFDIFKGKEDNYNRLTVENYLYTCADKENSKKSQLINNFIERKTKEQKYKKIGIEFEKIGKSSIFDSFKKLSTDHRQLKSSKKNYRSPKQFLDDQKILEEKHKAYINNLIKIHNEEIDLCIKDRPTITKQSKNLANRNNNSNKNIHLKLYEEFYHKKKKREEKNKNKLIMIIIVIIKY